MNNSLCLEDAIKRLSNIKNELGELNHDITAGRQFVFNFDDIRLAYLRTEIDTLLFILESSKIKRYKESFIMLRSTFEKFLYYWLMLKGTKYRWIVHYHIEKQSSMTTEGARDTTLDKWLKEKESGNEAFQDARKIEKGKQEDEIIVSFEREGAIGNDDKVVPMYHFMLENLNADIVHLSRIKYSKDTFIKEKHNYLEIIKAQKEIYHRFFYIDSIIKNLSLNDLITEFTKAQILVHYNFLSKFIHPTYEGVKMHQHLNHEVQVYNGYKEEILVELIILYVSKLMYLYMQNFVYSYRSIDNVLTSGKYDDMIDILDQMSKNLWFLDSLPTSEDLRWSDSLSHGYYAGIKIKDPDSDLFYYTDPYERMLRLKPTS